MSPIVNPDRLQMHRAILEGASLIDPDELTKSQRRDVRHAMTAEGTSARAHRNKFMPQLLIIAAIFIALALVYAYLVMQHW